MFGSLFFHEDVRAHRIDPAHFAKFLSAIQHACVEIASILFAFVPQAFRDQIATQF